MQRQGLEPTKRVAYFEYDYTRDGGAVGDITLRGDKLPNDVVIISGIIHVNTALTSGGAATIALKTLAANDVKGATAVATWSANAILDTVPVGTAATSIRTTSGGLGLTMTVATAALTAGKFTVALEYF